MLWKYLSLPTICIKNYKLRRTERNKKYIVERSPFFQSFQTKNDVFFHFYKKSCLWIYNKNNTKDYIFLKITQQEFLWDLRNWEDLFIVKLLAIQKNLSPTNWWMLILMEIKISTTVFIKTSYLFPHNFDLMFFDLSYKPV